MHAARVGIVGASGYSGVEATRILANHPRVQLSFLSSDRWQGESVRARLGVNGPLGEMVYSSLDRSEELARKCDAVLLATPAEVSLELAPKILHGNLCLIDLSGAFRLRDREQYPAFYGFSHPQPSLLERAAYGLPELFRKDLQRARFIANPGCYPTAAALAVAPLLKHRLLDRDSIVFDAASGTTGAGRKGNEELSFSEVDEDFRAYRVFKHQHTPEIVQTLNSLGDERVRMTFTAHLLPIKRGILCTTYARMAKGREPQQLIESLRSSYGSEPFISLAGSADEVSLKSVVGTNRCLIGLAWDRTGLDDRRVLIISAIDNLIKGAAGQAVQNLNLAMGWPETEGLLNLRGFYP
jgi:N-acetyl-gamma-glutamyl-phosphate reductase